MFSIIVNNEEFKHISEGELIEIFKDVSEYYTRRLTKYFGIIGDENNIKEICIFKPYGSYEKNTRKIARCTVRLEKGDPYYKKTLMTFTDDDEKKNYSIISKRKDHYVIDVLSIREFNYETDAAVKKTKTTTMHESEVVNNLKKKELCMERKGSICDQKCSECSFNVTEDVFKQTIITAMELINYGKASDYTKGLYTGRKKAFEEMEAYKNLNTPREVINTEGYEPYCQVCRSCSAIYSKDGEKNVFCGKCGTLLNWDSVKKNEDNYERIRADSMPTLGIFKGRPNYLKRRRAIEEYLGENKPRAKAVDKAVPIEIVRAADDCMKKKGK